MSLKKLIPFFVSILLLVGQLAMGKAPSFNDPGKPLPVFKKIKIFFNENLSEDSLVKQRELQELKSDKDISDITGIIEDNITDRSHRRAMMRFLTVLKVKRVLRNEKYKAKLYTELANISARLKLYPLAMQFCHQERQAENDSAIADTGYAAVETGSVPDTSFDPDSIELNTASGKNIESEPVAASEILESFEDEKEASDYALIVHVKQPVHGKRKAFSGMDNVGHMFITLIKYNTDKSYAARSFGFYLKKNSFFSSTPLHPAAPAVFKDDALHDWDEAIGKFISHKRFLKIIKLLTKYECKTYNLNQNNCTDFGLTIASLSGISVKETKGTWPFFGKGNNPANAGQSILENKILT